MTQELSHLDEKGRIRLVDVSAKPVTRRWATAEGRIKMRPETRLAIRAGEVVKGNVAETARLAAIGGAKRTSELIPLCHPLPLDAVDVSVEDDEELPGLRVVVRAGAEARTGVEMEALCGVSAGLLAVYDMCKAADREMEILGIRLLAKEGGSSGRWVRAPDGANEE